MSDRPGRLAALAGRIGWTEGEAWTAGIGLSLALALAVATVPAALEDRPPPRARASAPGAGPALPAVPAQPAPPPNALVPPVVPVQLTSPLLLPALPASGFPIAPAQRSADDRPPLAPAGPAALAPGALIAFAPVGVGSPGGIALTAGGDVTVGTDGPPAVPGPSVLLTWDVLGRAVGSISVPDQPTERERGLTAVDASPDGTVLAVDAATDRVLRHDPRTGSWTDLAVLPDLPPCLILAQTPCQPGLLDTAPLPRGLVVDATGTAYVADAGQGVVWRLRPGGALEVWWSSADVIGEDGLAGLALDPGGALLAAVTRLADLQGTGPGAVLRIERAADGSAGARTTYAAFLPDEEPVDIAVGDSGHSYVALRGADAMVVLDGQGVERLRVTDSLLGAPTALVVGAGRVYLTTTVPAPAVLQVGVADRPLR